METLRRRSGDRSPVDQDEKNEYTGSVSIGYRISIFNNPLFRSIKQGLIARIMPLFDGSKNGRVKTKIL